MKPIKRLTLFILLIWLTGYVAFVFNVLNKQAIPISALQKTDAIIVLTGGSSRIHTGLTLFSEDLANKLFITGVNKTTSDNDISSLWSGETPLPCCIELGREATTTKENAIETKNWIEKNDVKTITLVTSNYHIDRAVQEFINTIPNVEIQKYPVPEQKYSTQHIQFWKLTFSEYNKIIFRKIVIMLESRG